MALHGVLVVDKPAGPTSHDVVDRVRRALALQRVGHAGTLDPFATGVLPVCVGKATRLLRFLSQGQKVYRAQIRLGFGTTTDDATGTPLGAAVAAEVSDEALHEACRSLTGELLQVPPAYSAKRMGGRRLYELAREGAVVERRAAPVTVHSLELLVREADRLEVEVRCSPGTYVRSLARDLGQQLGVGAHLTALRRTRSGAFGLETALSWEELGPGVGTRLQPLSSLLLDVPAAHVGPEGALALRHGRDLDRRLVTSGFPDVPPPERLRILDESGELIGLAVPRGFVSSRELPSVPVLHPDVVLVD